MDGILLFDKPIGWTSHDAVDFLRRKIGQRKVGHAGTLDPMATGLLVLLAGRATKRSSELLGLGKEYSGVMTFGVRTDTQDFEGRLLEGRDPEMLRESDIRQAFEALTGKIFQTPPAYSAVKRAGKKLYEMARLGVIVECEAREIHVERFRLTEYRPNECEAVFSVSCSKGTYVRSLCDAVGQALGVGAALSTLRRTRIGAYTLNRALDEKTLSDMPMDQLALRALSEETPLDA